MKRFVFGALLLSAWFGAPGSTEAVPNPEPMLGVRIRQEYLPNAYYFDPSEDDRNWVRYRTRAGLRWSPTEAHTFEFRLVNEFRKIYEPDTKIDYDEIIIDRLLWRWRSGGEKPVTVTLGRQDIVWNEGFLVLEGRPLDGSRSMFQTGLRVQREFGDHGIDVAFTRNPIEDPVVVAGTERRLVSDGDERALLARYYTKKGEQVSLIVKRDEDPYDTRPVFTSYTLDLRRSVTEEGFITWLGEAALQHQITDTDAGFAWAGNVARSASLGEKTSGKIGFFYYSGEGRGMKGFRSPYGRWPKWSELWVYSLIPEAGVSQWQDLASPYFEVRREICSKASFQGALLVPYAPVEHWKDRGMLTIMGVKTRITPRLSAHFLWEWHLDGQYPAAMEETAHFIRWQFSYDI